MFWLLFFIYFHGRRTTLGEHPDVAVRMTSVLDFVRTVTGEFETATTTSVSLFGTVLKLVKAFVVHISF